MIVGKRGDISMKYKEDWDYEGDSHKSTCKKHEKHEKYENHNSCKDTCKKHEKHEDYTSHKDTCKKIRVINLWKSSSKY